MYAYDTARIIYGGVLPEWFIDTLDEAGDNSMYTAKRMSNFRLIKGEPFVPPITEEQILSDVRMVPEVEGGADYVRIAEGPSEGKDYYLVETGTRGEDNVSRLFLFRVYIYPKYEIRIYDAQEDADFSMEEWRMRYDKPEK